MQWTDEVLPLFDQPEPKQARARSKKDDADAAGIRWTRYKGARVGCTVCVAHHAAGGKDGIGPAAYHRTHGPDSMYLCTRHTAEQRDNEALGRG